MKKCKLFFTSDVHGYFYPTTYGDLEAKPVGLFGCADDFVKDEDTLIMDGGDILQGSAFAYFCKHIYESNEPISSIMNDIGYDYYTLGNHDFNYGQEYQGEYISKHEGRCVCENVLDANQNRLYPYDIRVMKNGLRIGIVGIVTDFINVWEKKENLVGIQITDPFEAAKKALEELKGKTDINICIYHGGFERDLDTGEVKGRTRENVGYRICEELDFDVLLTGHQHMSIAGRMLHGTYIVQPLDNAKEYHYVEILYENGIQEIRNKKVCSNPDSGKTLQEKYQWMEQQVQEWLNRPVGHLSKALKPDDKLSMALHGSPIADFLNRIQLYFSQAQLSTVGLANDIAGFNSEVTTRDIIATYPYPNTLVVCSINGKQLKTVMERSAEYFTVEDGKIEISKSFLEPKVEHYNYDYYAGVTYDIVPQNPVGSRICNLRYQGQAVSDNQEFTICMNNYRFSGTGGYPVYPQCPVVKEINLEMVELIMEYFRTHSFIEV